MLGFHKVTFIHYKLITCLLLYPNMSAFIHFINLLQIKLLSGLLKLVIV